MILNNIEIVAGANPAKRMPRQVQLGILASLLGFT
jgi:hypothetical protein